MQRRRSVGVEIHEYKRADIEREIAALETVLQEVEERRSELLVRLGVLRESLAKMSTAPDDEKS